MSAVEVVPVEQVGVQSFFNEAFRNMDVSFNMDDVREIRTALLSFAARHRTLAASEAREGALRIMRDVCLNAESAFDSDNPNLITRAIRQVRQTIERKFSEPAPTPRAEVAGLVEALELALNVAESWIHDQLDGTGSLEGELAVLEPARQALAAFNATTQEKSL